MGKGVMKRWKVPKRIARYIWLLIAVLFVFAALRLPPLLLIHAAETGNVSLTRFALEVGASPNTQTSRMEQDDVVNALAGRPVVGGIGCPVLLTAAFGGSPAVVKLLLNAGADPNRGDGAMPPLMAAVMGGNAECVRLLLLHGADPNGHYKDNTSVLDSAQHNALISAILKQAGAKGEGTEPARNIP